jgi:4-hydroxy-tetrahydrodipicolinate synthase
MADLGAILTAMVTPFDADGRVDDAAAAALMNHLLDHGSDGLVIAGTTGEAPTLSDDEQLALIGLAVREVGDRGTIVAGTGSNETRHAVHLTERATELGAHATLSVTPYYNRPNQRGIIAHYEAVAAATDRPIIIYNIPQRTGTNMPPELLARLAQIDGIDAVKQANNDELAMIDGLDVYAGNDDILARTLDLGGAGGILVASHLVGDQMHQMVDEPERRAEIDADLHDVFEALSVAPAAVAVKTAYRLLGRPSCHVRLPYVDADEAESATIRAMLEHRGLLSGAVT